MKRPVTSLCRRPGKKTACGAACPRCGNNSHPQGRSMVGKWSCRAKAARTRAQKQPRRRPGAVRRLRPWESGGQWGVWCQEGTALGDRRGKGHARRKNSPRRGPGTVCRLRPWGNGGQWGCLVPGRRRTGCPPGQRARPGAKTAPGGAGGCLDAGYGCYLPRAIRVIWMHRVGSTARPRIMPS